MSDDTPSEALPADDARLLASLGHALADDPAPSGLLERAEALVTLLDLDRDLAELLDVSAAELAGTRGVSERLGRLEFEVADGSVSIDLEIEIDALRGTVLTGEVAEIVLETVDGEVSTDPVDELGRFTFERPAPGPHRLRVHTGDARRVTTDWFTL